MIFELIIFQLGSMTGVEQSPKIQKVQKYNNKRDNEESPTSRQKYSHEPSTVLEPNPQAEKWVEYYEKNYYVPTECLKTKYEGKNVTKDINLLIKHCQCKDCTRNYFLSMK